MRQGLPLADIGGRTSGRADKTGGQSLDTAATCVASQHRHSRPHLPPHQIWRHHLQTPGRITVITLMNPEQTYYTQENQTSNVQDLKENRI